MAKTKTEKTKRMGFEFKPSTIKYGEIEDKCKSLYSSNVRYFKVKDISTGKQKTSLINMDYAFEDKAELVAKLEQEQTKMNKIIARIREMA